MLKLAYSATSPYVRKVRVCAMELGLQDQLELVATTVLPTEANVEYMQQANPLGKIPALTLENGTVIFDSSVICEYLNHRHPQAPLLPAGDERWQVLTEQQLADGMTDALVGVRYENWLRPEALRWAEWTQGQMKKVEQGLAWFEAHPERLQRPLNLGQIALACTLGYLDFRFADLHWRNHHPQLASWYGEFSQRSSMQATTPP